MQAPSRHDSKRKSRNSRSGDRAATFVRDAKLRLLDAAGFLAEASFASTDSRVAQRLANLARAAGMAAQPLGEITRSLRGRP